ncbi:MAG: hypothetical protein R3B93_02730 [Bacteroidia bacterium]
MENKTVDILLVEDNASDAELILISLEEKSWYPVFLWYATAKKHWIISSPVENLGTDQVKTIPN